MSKLIPVEIIENRIFLIRGQKVMLDHDLAALYRVPTKILNKAVNRNIDRFPADFMFQLTGNEFENLRFHFGTSSWGGRRYFPLAFTEQGIAMLSSVLKSKNALQVNITIMRTFVKLRQILSTHKELAEKIAELERKYNKHDIEIQAVFKVLKQMLLTPKKPKPKIGFKTD